LMEMALGIPLATCAKFDLIWFEIMVELTYIGWTHTWYQVSFKWKSRWHPMLNGWKLNVKWMLT
jgi:hypothetical protein